MKKNSSSHTPVGHRKHSLNVPKSLDSRVRRCMQLEGQRSFTDFMNTALIHRCREIERDNGIDAHGRPIKA